MIHGLAPSSLTWWSSAAGQQDRSPLLRCSYLLVFVREFRGGVLFVSPLPPPPPISSDNLDTLSLSVKWLCCSRKFSVVPCRSVPSKAMAATTTLPLGAALPSGQEWTHILSVIPHSTSKNRVLECLVSLPFRTASGITKNHSSAGNCISLCSLLWATLLISDCRKTFHPVSILPFCYRKTVLFKMVTKQAKKISFPASLAARYGLKTKFWLIQQK